MNRSVRIGMWHVRYRWLWVTLCFGAVAINPAGQAQSAPPLRHTRLHVLASRSLAAGLNVADVQAAGTVWLQVIGRRRGFQLDSRFEVVESLEVIRKQLEEFSADLVILDPIEYLKLAPLGLLQPFVAIARGKNGTLQNDLLVVNRASGSSDVADLRGKNILSCSRSETDMGRIWIETLLNEEHLERAEHFFGSITHVLKPSSACLPVFFGKLDACIVNNAGWEVLTEMNPQLSSKLRIIATSPPFLEGLLCIHVKHKDFREELLQSLLDLHRDPEGKQLLMVFKGERVLPVSERDIDTSRELWRKYAMVAAVPNHLGKSDGAQTSGRP